MTDDIPSSPTESPDAATRLPVAFLLVSFVLVLDYVFLGGTFRQLATLTYRQTEGQILTSAETSDGNGDGAPTHGVAVTYDYVVDGRSFRGTRYSTDDGVTTSGSWAREAVEHLPPGARVPVFYPPGEPSRAVLRQGVDGSDLFSWLVMFPFNALALGACGGYALARRAEKQGRRYVDPGLTPGRLAFLVGGFSPLLLVALVALGFGTNPPVSTMAVALSLPFVFAGLVFWRASAKRQRDEELGRALAR